MRDLNLIQFAVSIVLICLVLFGMQQNVLDLFEGLFWFAFGMCGFVYSGYRLITEGE